MARHPLVQALWRLLLVLVPLGVVYFAVLRTMYYHSAHHERSTVGSSWSTKGFEVAIVWPKHVDLSFAEGVLLGVEEINAAGGPLAGKIRLRLFEEPRDGSRAEDIARKIASYPDVVAVLGHEFSADAIPASVTYEDHGILFMTPTSTDPLLTLHGFSYVFRLTPDDEMIADAIAHFAQLRGWQRVGVLYGRNRHGDSAAEQFRLQANKYGVELAFFRSYLEEPDPASQDFRPLVAEIRQERFDAIMLADIFPWAAKMIVDMARMGVTQPIVATDKLDSELLWQLAGAAANNVYVASAVDPTNASPTYQTFRQRFARRFGIPPSYAATQGFESLTVLANACVLSQSADPIVVATTLRTNNWTGLFGPFAFDVDGDVLNRRISMKRMQNGTFVTEAIVPSEKDNVETLAVPGR
jgi:branched-chain amino acid transport system substrate-binding protein